MKKKLIISSFLVGYMSIQDQENKFEYRLTIKKGF